jgi:hypothetical protein
MTDPKRKMWIVSHTPRERGLSGREDGRRAGDVEIEPGSDDGFLIVGDEPWMQDYRVAVEQVAGEE